MKEAAEGVPDLTWEEYLALDEEATTEWEVGATEEQLTKLGLSFIEWAEEQGAYDEGI